MVIVRCTGKVLSLLRVRPASLAVLDPSAGDWYVNLVWIARRKCLLITHAGTLFSVFVADAGAADLRPPGPLIASSIRAALRSEGFPVDALGDLDPDEVTLARTADRRVLGAMNDHVVLVEHLLAGRGGLAGRDLDDLHHALHRTINSVTGYIPPIELVAGASG